MEYSVSTLSNTSGLRTMERDTVSLASTVRELLLLWFASEGRRFPWRESRDPFTVLVAEVLLKKTGARVVAKFLPGFLTLFPSASILASTSLERLEEVLGPIGLSRQRAEQLKSLGSALVERHGGLVPCCMDDLLSLPAVGPYTASAVLCFAYDRPEAIVDTNVARVVVRVFGISPSRYEARRSIEVWEAASAITQPAGEKARHVNWAMLDLGALVCKARKPACDTCPLMPHCSYFQTTKGKLVV